MTNIVQFPTTKARSKSKVSVLEAKMKGLQRMLNARYEHLRELDETIETVTAECTDLEDKYDILISGYGDRIGPENIDPSYLEYTNCIEFVHDELGNIHIQPISQNSEPDNENSEEEPTDA
jgi:hypothetical protein